MLAFPLAFAISALAGFLWLAFSSPHGKALEASERDAVRRTRIDAGLCSLLGGLLGSRLAFMFAHLGYYSSRPAEIFQLWEGGLSWPGAVIGALLALYLYRLIRGGSFWDLADALAPPAAMLALGLWIGCQIDHCAYGVGDQTGLLAIVSADTFGVISSRWPTQVVGAVCSALILIGVILLRDRFPQAGVLASLTLTLLAAMMLLLSLTRGDPVGALWGLRLDTLGSAVILTGATVALALRIWRRS